MNYNDLITKSFDNIHEETYLEFLKKKYKKFKYVCIFGMGNLGKGTADALTKEGIVVDFFCDNDSSKTGDIYKGVECISLDELTENKEDTIIIIATRHYKDIYRQLSKADFKNLDRIFTNKFDIEKYISNNDLNSITSKLIKLIDILEDNESKRILNRIIEEWFAKEYKYGQVDDIYTLNQYFTKDLIQLSEDEVFVDGGSYIGDTIDEFLINSNSKFDEIIAFELNNRVYNSLKDNINQYDKSIKDKITLFNAGLSDSKKEIFYDDDDEGSSISNTGNSSGKTENIDSILNDRRITFIKMDIEGSEMEALEGARNTIKKYKPKLAICLYHKPQDLWEIPLLIKEMVPEYKIYIRHHTDLLNETVCYAVPE